MCPEGKSKISTLVGSTLFATSEYSRVTSAVALTASPRAIGLRFPFDMKTRSSPRKPSIDKTSLANEFTVALDFTRWSPMFEIFRPPPATNNWASTVEIP